MSELATTVEPGWRPDPSGRYEWRYWDGGWTNRVANSVPSAAMPGASAPPAPVPTAPGPPPFAPSPPPSPPPSPLASAPPVAPAPVAPAVAPVPMAAAGGAAAGGAAAATAAPREPFGVDAAGASTPAVAPAPARARTTPWAWLVGFLRSFADQPESYQSPSTTGALPPDPHREHAVAVPGNYGAAGLVALAACGVAAGAYLPWLKWTIGDIHLQETGVDLGHFWAYALGAATLSLSALLSVQFRKLRWLTMALTLVMSGFVVRDLLDSYDQMQVKNTVSQVDANLGMGLMIMVVSAAIAMVAAVRLTEREKIV